MNFEERAVLENRLNIKESFREKEWWFTYCYDEKLQLYFGCFFLRTYPIDHFNFICFDLKNNKRWEFEKDIRLSPDYEKGKLDLKFRNKDFSVSYVGNGDGEREFLFKSEQHTISLNFKEGPVPPFTKRDNNFVNNFTLFHLFQQRVKGTLNFEGNRYDIDTQNSYYDHCSGKSPSNTGWHWLAVNNEKSSLASLINYGSNAQKYTQFYGNGEWHRLFQDVSFEYDMKNLQNPWSITSPDMELIAEPMDMKHKIIKVPRMLPFLIDIVHYEFIVKVNGRVRINNKWVDFSNAYGVMEEHHGKW